MSAGPDYKDIARILLNTLVHSTSLLEATMPLITDSKCRVALGKVVEDCRKIVEEAGSIL